MKLPGLVLALIASLALSAALAACGGGDDGLSDEEYFRRMDEIDKDLDQQFEPIFGEEGTTAKDGGEQFLAVVEDAESQYGNVTPPDDLNDEHDEVLAAISEFNGALRSATDNASEEDPFFQLFEDEALAEADQRVTDAFCAVQAAADEKNIQADVGCDDEGEEQEDPRAIEPVEATEVEIQDFVFDPPHIQVNVGDTVTWTQGADPEAHTATADDDSFDTGVLSDQGDTGEFTFEEPGEYPYFCEIHPEMLGQVTAVP
jgi:plastocyanin